MEELINEALDYLQKVEDEDHDIFTRSAYPEIIIPETKKGITNLVIKNQSMVLRINKNIRYKLIPQLRQVSEFLGPYVLEDYENYFDNEHTCLLWIRKLLKSRVDIIDNLPVSSCCGILTQCLLRSDMENSDKLKKLINTSQSAFFHGINTIIPREWEIPSNDSLIKKMSYTLREKYRSIK